MDYLVICLAALFASGLTLFSGFGLGTLLLPLFAIFFPIDIAIGLTALVHFLNNLFKLSLLRKFINKSVVLRFGLPAIGTAFVGAWCLVWLADLQPLLEYQMFGRELAVMPVKLVVAILMIIFASFDLLPRFKNLSFDRKYLPVGGLLSGFFGGLSGHQGALRSAFLIQLGLSREVFIGTGVAIACMVDAIRISVYGGTYLAAGINANIGLLVAAVLSAFLGAYIGRQLIKKVTMRAIQLLVGVMLILLALGIGTGFI